MSGGRFSYNQSLIKEMACDIKEILENYKLPRPPQRTIHFFSVGELRGEGCYSYGMYSSAYTEWDINLLKQKYFNKEKYTVIETKDDGTIILEAKDIFDNDGNLQKYKVKEGTFEEDVPDLEGYCYEPKFSEETLKKFKEAVHYLNKAYIYAQRVDWLLSGDDGEDSFHKRLKEELEKLEQDEAMEN